MRADRLLSILMLLQVHRRMTGGELARRLEVSGRTIHRDMEALSASGVPVVAERGAGGGWYLSEGYQTKLTGLNQSEIQALFVTQTGRIMKDLGLEQASDRAVAKLMAALPAMYRENAEYVRQRIHIDLSGWQRSGESVESLPLLQDAVLQERRVSFTYERSDGTQRERLVDPLGLVAKGNAWYLVAVSEGEVRTYRVTRIRNAQPVEEAFERPPGFDLAAFWAQSSTEFVERLPQYPATIRVSPSLLPRLQWAGRWARIEQVHPHEAGQWARVSMRFETLKFACEHVLGLGPQVEVIEPQELRDAVIEAAQSVLRLYGHR